MDNIKAVDTHLHFLDPERFDYPWMADPQLEALAGPYRPAHLAGDVETAGVTLLGCVHVQGEVDHAADPVLEMEWLQEMVDHGDLTAATAGVGYADLLGASLPEVAERYASMAIVRGVRQEAWCDPSLNRADVLDEEIITKPEFERGLRELTSRDLLFELLVFASQLPVAAGVFARHPELDVVLEHLGMPALDPAGRREWRQGMQRFAEQVPQAVLKISGMGMLDPQWSVADMRPVVLEAIEIFGPQRCMLASNYPVERLAGDYAKVWRAFDEISAELSTAERDDLFFGTARRTYRL